MRSLFALSLATLALASFGWAQGEALKVEVKGPHLCCGQCFKVAESLVAKVPGLADIKAEGSDKTVRFTAKDEKAARAGFRALVEGGFFGTATQNGKEFKIDLPAAPTGKADVVVVKDVHVCCKQCQNGIQKLFQEAKISYEGKGAQRTVRLEQPGLDRAVVLETLQKGGFYGTVEK